MKIRKGREVDTSSKKSLREFVSEASLRPASGSTIRRVNFSLTSEDTDLIERYGDDYRANRVSILRAALSALAGLDESTREKLISDAEKNAPKTGRPPVKR